MADSSSFISAMQRPQIGTPSLREHQQLPHRLAFHQDLLRNVEHIGVPGSPRFRARVATRNDSSGVHI
jgi:hypothetical protein